MNNGDNVPKEKVLLEFAQQQMKQVRQVTTQMKQGNVVLQNTYIAPQQGSDKTVDNKKEGD